ncbi:ATR-interacting protein mus304 [Melanaphis sacchari]|uniref:ATR-interacting protein mus304 n=1 Tax=Melanaphis sacchari TaxID=742174 RepID=UPI000DC14986|nr:ATR-interacting protein mus304 [Melanaphis sacchari]
MSKRPRTEPSTNGQEDIWGDDFTYDEVNSIVNIESLASQSHFSVSLNHPGKQKDNQIREGEIKNLKNKIKQLEIQLSNTKQENDDKFKNMKHIIDCKDTELKFQQQEMTSLKNKIKEMKIINKNIPQKNVSFSCMKTGSNSTLLHNASEHNIKKNTSTQTMNNEQYLFIRDHFPEINKSYEKLKKCLYPDLLGIQSNQNDVRTLSAIQDCHLILAKLMVLETFDEFQSYSLIELLFENCKHILESTVEILQETIEDEDFVHREKQLIYNYLNLNKQYLKNRFSMFDLQFSHLLDCISVLTTISTIVPRIIMNHSNNLFQTVVQFLQLIGSQSRTLEYVSVIIALIKFLTNLCSCNWEITKQKQLDIYDIIKEIVFCRPCINIIRELINLLSKISIYTEITDNLCQLSDNLTPKTFILSDRISTFTTGTCVLRVLCLQLELLKHSNHLITNYLYFVYMLLNSTHVPKWMHKIPNKTCDCTASFIDLTIQCLYTVFNIYEKGRESCDTDLLKLVEEIVENSYSILYRLGKLDEEFRTHISKCKGRYDVIVRKIQKLEFDKSNKFLVKELKKFEFKSLTHSQYNSSVIYEVFPIDKPKFTQKSQYQFDEPNKQIVENN